jgi:6-phosphogluconolactonase
MSLLRRALAIAAVVAAPAALTVTAGAASAGSPGAVYVLSNQTSGNQVLVFDRHGDGGLDPAGSYDTLGTGTGGGLGSQGAVVIDDDGRYLYAVNAGSDTITSFRIRPHGLDRVDVVASGGDLPTSLTVHDDVLYVLNAGGPGGINGFRVRHGELDAIAGSAQPLSATGVAPAQVLFSPDGRNLVVTERATNRLDVYDVGRFGRASGPQVVDSAGATPFGFAFDGRDHVVVSEAFGGAADASAVSSYGLDHGELSVVSASVGTTETAACWIAITDNGRFAYAGNAGTASVTGYRIRRDGSLTILDADGKTGSAAAGVTDLAMSANSRFLYGRLGNGTVGGWVIGEDGSLQPLGATPGLPAGAAGIAAT